MDHRSATTPRQHRDNNNPNELAKNILSSNRRGQQLRLIVRFEENNIQHQVLLKLKLHILILMFALTSVQVVTAKTFDSGRPLHIRFAFLDDSIYVTTDSSICIPFDKPLALSTLKSFYTSMNASNWRPLVDTLLSYQKSKELNDWMYYQLIRKTAQQIAPKADNYLRYTLYKWFLLSKSGFDATLGMGNKELLFYVYTKENIYDIPFYTKNGRTYMCLNYHDYGKIDFDTDTIREVDMPIKESTKPFSYKITKIPEFKDADYVEKDIKFKFHGRTNHFSVKMNPMMQAMLTNYPVVDFELYFNIPLSSGTYASLIKPLKNHVKGMNQKRGIDYLMRFTRYAFLYESDQDNFGKEKHMCPEQTLFYQYSDCDDRAALFFYLVKEIYNLPMIALLYPQHVLLAIKLDHPIGKTVLYNNIKYSVCDPTPQEDDLKVGQVSDNLKEIPFQVVYEYHPGVK